MFGSKTILATTASDSSTPSDLEVGKEKIGSDLVVEHPRANIPTWKWILTLIGIYLGALLYGKSSSDMVSELSSN